jgi:hypothetical protein
VTKSHAFVVVAGTRKHLRARVSYLSGTRQVVIDPRKRLAHHTRYKVTVTTDVLDVAGNPLDQNPTRPGTQKKTWKFTTR